MPDSATPRLTVAVPTFPVDDVGATARWYAECLGFALAGTTPAAEPYAFASLQRDGVELMLLRLEAYRKPDLASRRPDGFWDVYIRMRDVRGLYEQLRGRPFVRRPLTRQSYGDWEFEVQDPNGYILVFGELTE